MKISEMRVAVTGGASGMGRAFSLQLAAEGATVAACDLREDGLRSLEQEAKSLPGAVKGFTADVSKEEDVIRFMDEAWDACGGLNGLVNNAGIFRDGLLVKKDRNTGKVRGMPLSQWSQVLAVDLTGPFLCTREFAARVIERGSAPAAIVNISSVSRAGNRGQSNYSAAKAGLVADTVVWAGELARYDIRVGAIAPGFIDTPILQGMRPEMLEQMLKQVPLRRPGQPQEILQGIKFIFECDYFTGRCIDIDGGLRL